MSEYINKCLDDFEEELKKKIELHTSSLDGEMCYWLKKKEVKKILKEKLEKQEIKHNRELVNCVEKSLEAQRKKLDEEREGLTKLALREAGEYWRNKLVLDEGELKSSMIFDFIHIILFHYYSGKSYEQTWEHNRERINLVNKHVEKDKEKITKAICKLQEDKINDRN